LFNKQLLMKQAPQLIDVFSSTLTNKHSNDIYDNMYDLYIWRRKIILSKASSK
jgi:hypothetical protein